MQRYLRDASRLYAPAGTSDVQLRRLAEIALDQSKTQWSQQLSAVLCPSPIPGPQPPGLTTMTTSDRPQISEAQQSIAQLVVRGASDTEISAQLTLSESTVRSHITKGRKILGCRPGSNHAVYVHALLCHRQVLPPQAPRPCTRLTEPEQRLLQAIAGHTTIDEIARAAGIHRDDVRLESAALRDKTGAVNDAHLVGIGHGLGLLTRPAVSVGVHR
jgi:DNA-binding CsgD family transcriptional regulator